MRRTCGLVLLLACLCGCGESPDQVPELIRLLPRREVDGGRGMPVAALAASRLGDIGDARAELPLVETLRTHPDGFVRQAAAVSLCQLQCLDAVPVLIDALTDMHGALRPMPIYLAWLSQLLGRKLMPPMPYSYAGAVRWQQELRGWWVTAQGARRKQLGRPGPSRLPPVEASPPHEPDVALKDVHGQYLGTYFDTRVLVYLRPDGYFERRGRTSGGSVWSREAGTWRLDADGVTLTWALREPLLHRQRFDYPDLAPCEGTPLTTVAHWSTGTLYLFPESQAPFCMALQRASADELAALPADFRFVPFENVVGRWTATWSGHATILDLHADARFEVSYRRPGGGQPVEKPPVELAGRWTWSDKLRAVTLEGTEALGPNGERERYRPGDRMLEMKNGTLEGALLDSEKTWEHTPHGPGGR